MSRDDQNNDPPSSSGRPGDRDVHRSLASGRLGEQPPGEVAIGPSPTQSTSGTRRAERRDLPTAHPSTGGGRTWPRPIGFVFPGGAAMGAVQAGTLRALVASGVRPDLIVGTSVGAINATACAMDPTSRGADRLVEIWSDVPRRAIFPLTPWVLVRLIRRGHLLDSRGLRAWLGERVHVDRLEDMPVPLYLMATDVERQEPVMLSRGDTVTAIMASCAIRRVFPPVEIDGRLLSDGGAFADHPVLQTLDLGARTVFELDTTAAHGAGQAPWRVGLFAAIRRWRGRPLPPDNSRVSWRRARRLPGGQPPQPVRDSAVHVLTAPPTSGLNPFSFRHSQQLMADAEHQTREWLERAERRLVVGDFNENNAST